MCWRKCSRALRNHGEVFSIYADQKFELVGYTACVGRNGGKWDIVSKEMKKNGVEVVHFATGMVLGYSPCPYIDHFKEFLEQKMV